MLWATVCCRWLGYRSGILSVRRHWLFCLTGKDSSSVWCNLWPSLGKKSPEKGVATPSDLARVSRVSKLLFHVRRSLESWTAEQELISGLKQTSSTLLSHCDSLGQQASLPDVGSPGRGMCGKVGIQGQAHFSASGIYSACHQGPSGQNVTQMLTRNQSMTPEWRCS